VWELAAGDGRQQQVRERGTQGQVQHLLWLLLCLWRLVLSLLLRWLGKGRGWCLGWRGLLCWG
jgi:hypothetical protein